MNPCYTDAWCAIKDVRYAVSEVDDDAITEMKLDEIKYHDRTYQAISCQLTTQEIRWNHSSKWNVENRGLKFVKNTTFSFDGWEEPFTMSWLKDWKV